MPRVSPDVLIYGAVAVGLAWYYRETLQAMLKPLVSQGDIGKFAPLLLVAVAVWWGVGHPGYVVPSPDRPRPPVPVNPHNPFPAPPAHLQTALRGVTQALSGHGDVARELAAFGRDMAAHVQAGSFTTTSQLRVVNGTAEQMIRGAMNRPVVPGLKVALDAAQASVLGLDSRTIDTSNSATIQAFYAALAWAAMEAV